MRPGYKLTEIGVFPEGWAVMPLEAIADKIMVGIASAATHAYREKGVPMFRNQNIKRGQLDDRDLLFVAPEYELTYGNKRLRGGDLLTMRTGYPGVTAIVPPQYESAQSFTTLITRPNANRVESAYLCHYINSERGQRFFTQSQIGGAQKNVNAGTLRGMPIPLPPIHEQRAIAATLGDMDALLGGLDRLIAKKRDLKQAAMQQLLTGQTRLPGFQEEWEVKRLGEVSSIRNQKVMPSNVDPETLCVELEHIGQGDGRLVAHSTARNSTSSKYRFYPGDVLFGRLRSYLRKYWLADRAGICTTEIWPLMVDHGQVDSSFLLAVVQSNRFIEAAGISYGTHMPRADWGVIRNFEVRLPSVTEQTAIATVLSDMDDELIALEARRNKTRDLNHAMMQELLTGRTRLV